MKHQTFPYTHSSIFCLVSAAAAHIHILFPWENQHQFLTYKSKFLKHLKIEIGRVITRERPKGVNMCDTSQATLKKMRTTWHFACLQLSRCRLIRSPKILIIFLAIRGCHKINEAGKKKYVVHQAWCCSHDCFRTTGAEDLVGLFDWKWDTNERLKSQIKNYESEQK